MLIFLYTKESVLIFLNIWSNFLVQTSFLSMLVGNDRNLFVAKMFLTYTIITEHYFQPQVKIMGV